MQRDGVVAWRPPIAHPGSWLLFSIVYDMLGFSSTMRLFSVKECEEQVNLIDIGTSKLFIALLN